MFEFRPRINPKVSGNSPCLRGYKLKAFVVNEVSIFRALSHFPFAVHQNNFWRLQSTPQRGNHTPTIV